MDASKVDYRCTRCGSADVQVGMFVNPNTGQHDGEWLHDDQDYAVNHGYQWCEKCGEHVYLADRVGDEAEFRGAERRAAFVRGFEAWVAFDSMPSDPVEAVGFKAAEHLAKDCEGDCEGAWPTAEDAIDECIHFFDREED